MICNIQWFVPETPPPKLGHSWVVFEGWPQILPSTKLFSHGFQRSCSVMTTQKFEKKVQQHDEVVESSKTGCRSQSSAHGKACGQVPALICDTYALRILCTATIWGGCFAQKEQNNPPKYLGNKSEIPHLNFTTWIDQENCGIFSLLPFSWFMNRYQRPVPKRSFVRQIFVLAVSDARYKAVPTANSKKGIFAKFVLVTHGAGPDDMWYAIHSATCSVCQYVNTFCFVLKQTNKQTKPKLLCISL